jgi:hypothetical protein
MKVDVNRVNNENIDYVTRIGRRKGERLILVKFISFSKTLQVLRNKRNLAGSRIRVEEDLPMEDRKVRKELIPYLMDAKRRGHKAFLRKGSLIVDGRAYGLSYLKGNIQVGDVNVDRQMDKPAGPQDDMTQHQTGNGATRESDTSQQEEACEETASDWKQKSDTSAASTSSELYITRDCGGQGSSCSAIQPKRLGNES